MRRSADFKQIEEEAEKLPPEEQLALVERLARRLRRTGVRKKRPVNWEALYGRGKGLWGGEDAQEYVNHLREDRR